MAYYIWNFHNDFQNLDVTIILPSEYELWNISEYLEIFYIDEDKSITNNNIPIIEGWTLESIINKNGGKIYRYLLDKKYGMSSLGAFYFKLMKKIKPIMTECPPSKIMEYMIKGSKQSKVSDIQKGVLVRKLPESDAYLARLESTANSMPSMKPLSSWFHGFYTYGGGKSKKIKKSKKSKKNSRKRKRKTSKNKK